MSVSRDLISRLIVPKGIIGWILTGIGLHFFKEVRHQVFFLIAEKLDIKPDDRVLDVACGDGLFLERYIPQAHHITGIELSPVMVKRAQRRFQERIDDGSATILLCDAADLLFRDDNFSAVTCNCLGCFDHPRESLLEIFRVLEPGGRAVLTFEYYDIGKHQWKPESKRGAPVSWTIEEAEFLMEKSGFSNISVELLDNPRGLLVRGMKQIVS